MAKRKRNIQILFCVSPEEKKLIRRKMIESKTKNMGAYLRKMAIDGYIVNTDTTPLKKQYEEMHKIGVNINQIAKKVNSTGDLYPEEMQELKEMVKELWRIELFFLCCKLTAFFLQHISVNEARSLKQTSIVALSSRTRCTFLAMVFSLDNAIRTLLQSHNYN